MTITGLVAPSGRWVVYAIIVLLVATQLIALAQFAVWIPLGGPLANTFPQATASLAAAGSSFALAYAAGSLVAGPLADRHGRWPVLVAALFGLTATTLTAAASTTWPGYLASRVAQGLAAAAIPVAASSWVSDTLSPRGFATVEAIFTAAANQGAIAFGQLYGQVMGGDTGWRAAYAGLAAAYALTTLVVLATLALAGPTIHAANAPGSDANMIGVLRRALRLTRQPQLVLCWIVAGLLLGTLLAMYAGLEYYGYDPALLLRLRLLGLAGAAAAPLLLALLPPIRPGWLALSGLTVSVIALLAQGISGDFTIVAAGSALVAGGTTFALPPVAMLIVLLAPQARASALAVYGCCLALGASFGAELPARLPTWLGYPGLCTVLAALLGVVALALANTVPTDPAQTIASQPTPMPIGSVSSSEGQVTSAHGAT